MGKTAGTEVTINSLPAGGPAGAVRSVEMLGGGTLRYKQDAAGLIVTLPDATERKRGFRSEDQGPEDKSGFEY